MGALFLTFEDSQDIAVVQVAIVLVAIVIATDCQHP